MNYSKKSTSRKQKALKGKGKIEEGYDADLCILDQDLQLVEVIARGKTVYTYNILTLHRLP